MSDTNESGSEPGTNGEYLLAQFGDRKQRRLTLSMMLDPTDLPGNGWSVRAHKSWRTGKVGTKNERRDRAQQTGAYTGLRTYWNPNARRNVAARISPMASMADAEKEVPGWGLVLMVRPSGDGSVSEETEVEDVRIPHLPNAILTERAANGPDGATMMRMVRGNVDRVVFVLGCGALGDVWPWDELFIVLNLQVAKIQRAL